MPSTNALLQSILAASGGGATGFSKTYHFDASDAATATTPITHIGAAADTYLTNDNLGPNSNAYNPDSKDILWKTGTNKFDFTSLKIGDVVFFRVDLEFSNAAAQETDIYISLAEGQTGAYEKLMVHDYHKTAAVDTGLTTSFEMYIGNSITKNGGGRFRFASPVGSSIKVLGWYYRITSV